MSCHSLYVLKDFFYYDEYNHDKVQYTCYYKLVKIPILLPKQLTKINYNINFKYNLSNH